MEQASASARADATPSTTAALVKDALRQGAKEQGLELRSGSDEAATAGSSAAAARAQAQTEAALKRAGAMADAARGASRAMAGRGAARAVPVPQWHAPWKLMRVVTGHTGWVRCAAVDPSNQWYAVGSQDRTVRIYDLASSKLRLTLTGHVSAVRDVVVSERHPYMFTCSEDKQVFCWDLETNTVIRKYFGHTAGVFSLALHPRLDVLFSAGRDSTCRVWDIRTKHQVHCLQGHKDAVVSIGTQAVEPQVITGSMDRTARLWDLAAGKCQGILTHHKRAVRSIACSTRERSFVTAAADGIRKWAGVDVHLERTMEGHAGIVHSAALSDEGVLASAGDDGELRFWDYGTGYCFQSAKAPPQAGSLDSESAVFSLSFDRSGSRLVACGADKTIKVWGEDTEASEETHPIDMRAWQREARKHRRL